MSDYDKLNELYLDIDDLISHHVTSAAPAFIKWHTKLERFLAKKYGDQSKEYAGFTNRSFTPLAFSLNGYADYVGPCKRGLEVTKAELSVYLEEILEEETNSKELLRESKEQHNISNMSSVFIVHGHNEALKQSVARIVEKQNIKPIILHEQPNKGATIIEKFENNSDVGAAICLFTDDDIGRAKDEQQDNMRARQNVVFEAGFFMGKLGRDRVILLARQGIELPSDIKGVIYTDSTSWQLEVLRELRAMGFSIDYNKLD